MKNFMIFCLLFVSLILANQAKKKSTNNIEGRTPKTSPDNNVSNNSLLFLHFD